MQWLDLARYADTHGYHIDSHRDMWPWRDWVIDAFNRNMPFDRFTIEQLAGDLLPGRRRVSRSSPPGFNRNHMINFEGGAIPEEYQTEYVVDRVETTATVWLGLTMGCARCHDHKYDPITQKEFYRFFAFFNNVAEKGLDGADGQRRAVPDAADAGAEAAASDELTAAIEAQEEALGRQGHLAGARGVGAAARRRVARVAARGARRRTTSSMAASSDVIRNATDHGRTVNAETRPSAPGQVGRAVELRRRNAGDFGTVGRRSTATSRSRSPSGSQAPGSNTTMAVLQQIRTPRRAAATSSASMTGAHRRSEARGRI